MSSIRVADRYALDREIGRGGSGAVWLARDEVLGRSVAIKRIGLPPGASTYDVARAEREARISAQVNHANVVSVFDFVNDGDHTWLVTEYVEGTTLAQLIRDRGRLAPDEAAPLLLQTAEALAAAHAMSIVHRDVKPSNILVALDGTAKLSDFGIARAVADASLTQTGLVTGSPAYIAPEVATGSTATTASDVWSFGATIYHALSGHPPYEVPGGENAVLGVLYRVAHEPTPRLQDGGWLAPLVEATMAHEPANRMSMEDVVAFLRAGPQESSTLGSTQVMPQGTQVMPQVAAAPPPPTPVHTEAEPGAPDESGGSRTRPLRIALIGLAAVLVLAAIGTALLVSGGDDEPDNAALPNSTRDTTSANGSGTPSGSDTPSESDSDTPAAAPTAEEMETFAATYVETASSDPDAGFDLLTPDYQARSPEYAEFWGGMSNPEMLNVRADPREMTVTYTYKYNYRGSGKHTERVTLFLVLEGDQLLIDDAVSG